ncbi:ASCH domain-containing protein [Sutcliffiella rhizosphaerae]|uniref:ASCH domain-containing protein n=1 Tax=Sutcliffiella rhizosphaerae TaxID=2880967 RepID=A0ABN8A8U4_9BACI|nr:ASCH domain-containing protein [Sutcliffiella rhizosphaerae]CAG9621524.1 hypothetical protein BACCIP111883_02297 [Sutcliffiella rhizosphaerae]
MNKIQRFWNDFCDTQDSIEMVYSEAFQFGTDANRLASLVVEGKKTATCSAYLAYERENEALPIIGEFSIVLDANEDPVAVIKTESVEVVPMNMVSEDFAVAEGEGDYQYWWNAHEYFFRHVLKEYGLEYSPEMLLVCERFKKVYPR